MAIQPGTTITTGSTRVRIPCTDKTGTTCTETEHAGLVTEIYPINDSFQIVTFIDQLGQMFSRASYDADLEVVA